MYNHFKIKAFSLIELMVVIAIVALLAAVAVPAYKVYTQKANAATLVPLVNDFKQAILQFHGENNDYPWAGEIGYATVSTSSDIDNPTSYNPYLTQAAIEPWTGGTCPSSTLPMAGLIRLGMDLGDSVLYILYTIVYEKDGTYKTGCFEALSLDGGTSFTINPSYACSGSEQLNVTLGGYGTEITTFLTGEVC